MTRQPPRTLALVTLAMLFARPALLQAQEKIVIESSGVHGVAPGDNLASVASALRACKLNLRGAAREGAEGAQITADCGAALSVEIEWDIDRELASTVTVTGGTAKTRAGVGVGDEISKAVTAYGSPELYLGEGNVCATFEPAPGLSFCLADDAAERYMDALSSSPPKTPAFAGTVGFISVTGTRPRSGRD